jgi:hypothetical protein
MKRNLRKTFGVIGAAALLLSADTSWAQSKKWAEQVYANDDQHINDVATDGKGNSFVAGFFKGTYAELFDVPNSLFYDVYNTGGTTTYDGFIGKFDRAGTPLWLVNIGGTSNDYTTGVTVYPNGSDYDIYVCGHFSTTATFNSSDGVTTLSLTSAGLLDAYIAKYNSSGIVQWVKKIGSSTGNEAAYDIVATTPAIAQFISVQGAALYVCGTYGGTTTFDGSTPIVINNIGVGADGYLVRYIDDTATPDVNPDWVRRMGSSQGNESYYGVGTDGNGNVTVAGLYNSATCTYDISSSTTSTFAANGTTEAIAVNYTPLGNKTWSDHYGGSTSPGGTPDAAIAVAMDQNGNSYIGGYFTGTGTFGSFSKSNLGASGLDSYVISVSSTGTVQWATAGGTSNTDDGVSGIAVDNCGQRVYVAGRYRGSFSFDAFSLSPYNTVTPNVDGFFLALDASTGSSVSGRCIAIGGSDGTDDRTCVAVNALEDVFVGGSFASTTWKYSTTNTLTNTDAPTAGNYDGFIFRYDDMNFSANVSAGNAGHNGVGTDDCTIYAAGEMLGSGVTFGSTTLASTQYISTYTSDVYLTKATKFGSYTNFLKVTQGDANEYMSDQAVDASGNNYICGHALGSSSAFLNLTFNNSTSYLMSSTNMGWLCKTNSSGTVQWSDYIGNVTGASSSEVKGIAYDASGNVYITGVFTGQVNFNPTSGTPTTKTASSQSDMFVAKYSSAGVFQWVQQFSATTSTTLVNGYGISISGSDYYATGIFTGTTTFGANTLISAGGQDLFVMRGSTSTGAGTYGLKYGTVNTDNGLDVSAYGTGIAYVCGKSGNEVYIGKATLTTSTPSWTWNVVSTNGSGSTGERIDLYGADVIVGGTSNSATLALSSNTVGGTGAFAVRYSSTGSYVCSKLAVSSKNCYGIAVQNAMLNNDNGDNIIIAGGTLNSGNNNQNAFIHKLGLNCLLTERIGAPYASNDVVINAGNLSSAKLYPNPATGFANFEFTGNHDLAQQPGMLIITDITGRQVMKIENITSPVTIIETSVMINGVYQYQFVSGKQVLSLGKMVVMN